MLVRSLPVALVAFAIASAAAAAPGGVQTKPGPCVASGQGRITCGSGPGALVVMDGTTSPSGKLAIAWRSRSVDADGMPNDVDGVENHLVRFLDGKSLGIVVGRSWSTGEAQSNHINQTVAWSPDSSWLLVGDSGKWALEAIAIYSIDEGAGAAKRQGLFRPISSAAGRLLRQRLGASEARFYTLDIDGRQTIAVSDVGTVSLPMLFQIPKQDKDIDLLVKFKASRNGDRVTTTPIDVLVVKR